MSPEHRWTVFRFLSLLVFLYCEAFFPPQAYSQAVTPDRPGNQRQQEPKVLYKAPVFEEKTPDEASLLEQTAVRLAGQRKFTEALQLVQRALKMRESSVGPNNPEMGHTLGLLAFSYLLIGDYNAANNSFERFLSVTRDATDPYYAYQLCGMAMWLYCYAPPGGRWDRLIERVIGQTKRIISRSSKDDPDYIDSSLSLAMLNDLLGRYGEADVIYQQATTISKEAVQESFLENSMVAALFPVILGATGHDEMSRKLLARLQTVSARVFQGEDPQYAATLILLAMSPVFLGQNAESTAILTRAEKICRKLPPGELRELMLWPVGGKSGDEIGAHGFDYLTFISMLYTWMGQYEKAVHFLEWVLPLRKAYDGEDDPVYIKGMIQLAVWCSVMQASRATLFVDQTVAVVSRTLEKYDIANVTSLINLATACCNLGRYDQARPLVAKATQIIWQIPSMDKSTYTLDENMLTDVNTLAYLNYNLGQYQDAAGFFEFTGMIERQSFDGDDPLYASSLAGLAQVYQALNRTDEALATTVRALSAQQQHLKRMLGTSTDKDMLADVEQVGGSLDGLVNTAMSMVDKDPTVAETAMTWVLRRKAMVFETLIQLRALNDLATRDKALEQLSAQCRNVEQRISNLMLSPVQIPQGGVQLEALRRLRDAWEARLNTFLSQRPENLFSESISFESVRDHLPRGTALIEFVRVAMEDGKPKPEISSANFHHYFAFVLNPEYDASPKIIDLGDGQDCDKLVGDLCDEFKLGSYNVEKDAEKIFRKDSAQLYQQVFKPLRQALGSVTMIYLAPDGELNRIPFEALVDENGKYLIETYRFAYLSSGKALLRTASTKIGRGSVIFAPVDFKLPAHERIDEVRKASDGLQNRDTRLRGVSLEDLRDSDESLPATKAEADDVERVLQGTAYGPVRKYIGKEACKDAFLSLCSPRILHVATHGLYLADPKDPLDRLTRSTRALLPPGLYAAEDPLQRSCLLFAPSKTGGRGTPSGATVENWIVTAREIATMDLRGTELVVLSACKSGSGKIECGEGVYGMRRSFLYAGVRTLVTTLFEVPDAETRQLMGRFYNLLKQGRDKLKSLREAQLEMIHQRRAVNGAAHPYYWASFVLVGDPN